MSLAMKLDLWQKDLIDMSRNNALLYYRDEGVRAAGIRLPVANSADLFARLLLKNATLTPKDVGLDLDADEGLERRLERLRTRAREDLNERGLLTLYLVFGMFEWFEVSYSEEKIRSPLVLVPVSLNRSGRAGQITIKRAADDAADSAESVEINPTLRERLASSFGVRLPTVTEILERLANEAAQQAMPAIAAADDVTEARLQVRSAPRPVKMPIPALSVILDAIATSARQLPEQITWNIEPEAHLGRFSFQKLVMRQDLEKHKMQVLAHPLLRALGGEAAVPGPRGPVYSASKLDESVHPRETLEILDADSSQEEAVLLAKAGGSFVLQGPPGTGKSQTIANIIAESLGMRRSILFVSEKMAALDVVRKRLEDVGLGDFLLTLHDPRADKKAFVRALEASLASANPDRWGLLAAEWERDSADLKATRDRLNTYVRELHRPRLALGETAFHAYGDLARLASVPAYDFALPDIERVTHARLTELREALRSLFAFEDVLDTYTIHPWRAVRVTDYSLQIRSDIEAHYTSLSEQLAEAERRMEAQRQIVEGPADGDAAGVAQTVAFTFGSARQFLERIHHALNSPLPPQHWMRPGEPQRLHPLLSATAVKATAYQRDCQQIDPLYQPAIRALDHDTLLSGLRDAPAKTMRLLAPHSPSGTQSREAVTAAYDRAIAQRAELDTHLGTATATLRALVATAAEVAAVCDHPAPTRLNDIHVLLRLGSCLTQTPQPPRTWLDPDVYAEARIVTQEADRRYNECATSRSQLESLYSPAFFALDPHPIAERFRAQYQSLLRYARPQYYQDVRKLRSTLRSPIGQDGAKRSATLLETDIYRAEKLLDNERWLADHRSEHARALGRAFESERTNWPRMRQMVGWTDELYACLDGEAPNEAITRLATGAASARDQLNAIVRRFNELWEQWRIEAAYAQTTFSLSALPVVAQSLDVADAPALANALEQAHTDLADFWAALDTLDGQRLPAAGMRTWTERCNDLQAAQRAHEYETWLAEQETSLQQELGPYYQGTRTDWEASIRATQWCATLLKLYADAAPERLVHLISCEGDAAERGHLREEYAAAVAAFNACAAEFRWSEGVLPHEALLPRGVTHEGATLAAVRRRVNNLLAQLPLLQRWIECAQQIQRLRAMGLGGLLDRALLSAPFPKNIVDIFLRRFYTLWLDKVRSDCPTLQQFVGETHEQLISRFRRLDAAHLTLARQRLYTQLMQRRAEVKQHAEGSAAARYGAGSAASGSPSEGMAFAALRKEISKKRHSSIRAMVRNVAPALRELKPCWMMSPLSVSQFLDSGDALFDLVIFDEASQVSPEDAICAILRGKQLIVVGDTRQLPPTRFFAKTLADDDDEDGEEGEQPNQPEQSKESRTESILDECLGANLTERSLKWHYRSQHESLIAFSNHEFYQDALTTFPGPQASHSDGVRFIYVADGRYDRSNSRTNRREAERVVDVILDHAQRAPELSLGVVALSGAQQRAISDALDARLKRHPDLEGLWDYLNEDQSSPNSFFIKNLESVQGDERDVIILSVGYGKDAQGKIYTYFGPVNNKGGERRLNVAVTRARNQMIVVSSMRASDLPANLTNPGARTLRRYLDYAERGPIALQADPLAVRAGDDEAPRFESPFEEAVFGALTAKGLRLDTQVGCSQYRIDLAARDPERPDTYLLGIECDGATYHSSATARDRDRLRQRHLESLGWHIHRIWSSDWFQHPAREVEKTLAAVEQARLAREAEQPGDKTA